MKNFLKKIIFQDAPEKGALFWLALTVFGSLIWINLIVLLSGIPMVCRGVMKYSPFDLWRDGWILPVIFFIGLIVSGVRFGWKYRGELTFMKRWKWQLPTTGCWILGMAALIQGIEVLLLWDGSAHLDDRDGFITLFPGIVGVVVTYLGIAALIAGFFCTAKLISNASKIPYFKLFGKATISVLLIFVISWVGLAVMALNAGKKADAVCSAKAQEFNMDISAQALEKTYLENRTADPEFWKKAGQLYLDVEEWEKEPFNVFVNDPRLQGPAEKYAAWQKELEGNSKVKAWEKLFNGNIPPVERGYQRYKLLNMPMAELHIFRRFCVLEFWKVRFAAGKKDKMAALIALQRLENVRNTLNKDHFFLAALTWEYCEKLRLDALNILLDTFHLTPGELENLRQKEERHKEEINKMISNVMHSELIISLDWCDAFCDGKIFNDSFGEYAPAQRYYRWLLPSFWYNLNIARRNYIAGFSDDAAATAENLRKVMPSDGTYGVFPVTYAAFAEKMAKIIQAYDEFEKRCR